MYIRSQKLYVWNSWYLFKKKNLHDKLGYYLSGMLDNMSSRGPDSAGFNIYNKINSSRIYKYSICFPSDFDLNKFEININKIFKDILIKIISDHFVISTKTKPKYFFHFWMILTNN